ncbi:putative RTA1 domain protein [Pseudovirgaria hyperparasitica]|uniref:Putative RTA1 domain protein n=1 Tax=Pseudovirgaria hyperparasitica TaxID=470096 RepID=A0A6A6WIE7_9PEZI|nr:putative RTA1 domain protein [Pseudovirgaria hyperparasitica]KAF2760921.1 putative RTA1 domain protein [Pseudovirgaria hyperparasitica]
MAVITSPNGYIFYHYIPTQPGAIVVAVLFALGTLAVLYRSITTRTAFAIPFIIGGLRESPLYPQPAQISSVSSDTPFAVEVLGYIARALAKTTTSTPLPPFIMQNILLLIAPALFAASIYMTLGRVIRSVRGEAYSLIRPAYLTRFFVLLDVVSFFAQGTGGGFQASRNFNKTTAEYIILGGLVVQILGFGLFAVTAGIWHVRMRKVRTATTGASGRWVGVMKMLYVVSGLIMVRSVFRVVEYVMGTDGYLLRHEWPLYVFDAVLMMGTVGVFAWWYPGRLDVASSGEEHKADVGNDA